MLIKKKRRASLTHLIGEQYKKITLKLVDSRRRRRRTRMRKTNPLSLISLLCCLIQFYFFLTIAIKNKTRIAKVIPKKMISE